jgi:hypothetical protein
MRTIVISLLLFLAITGMSQEILDIAFTPLIDSMGEITGYIRKSHAVLFSHPKKKDRIPFYNERLELQGYFIGRRKRFIRNNGLSAHK